MPVLTDYSSLEESSGCTNTIVVSLGLGVVRKDQVSEKGEQSAHHRDVPRRSTVSPNDPEHDDAERWCRTAMNYIKGRIIKLIGDFD
uniref:Uncharacterized protein n=1 Tax=Solanum tuberosum TaxID=4113 RepID=M1DS43_SOLTU